MSRYKKVFIVSNSLHQRIIRGLGKMVCNRCSIPIHAGEKVLSKTSGITSINKPYRVRYYHIKCAEEVNLL